MINPFYSIGLSVALRGRWILFITALVFWMHSCQPCPAAAPTTLKVWVTAYSWREPEHRLYRDKNSLGSSLRTRIEGLDQIAVDPRRIPIGSIVHIEGVGRRIATDVGSAIQGRKVDLHFQTLAEMHAWQNRSLTITILRRGWARS